MKRYVKLFEAFGQERFCCSPMSLLDAFEEIPGDALRWAAFHINDFGAEQAERMAEGPEEAMAVRRLMSCRSSRGVDAIGMLDMLEDMRFDLDSVRMYISSLERGDYEQVAEMPGGRAFLSRYKSIEC
jgi:hypothetical protein